MRINVPCKKVIVPKYCIEKCLRAKVSPRAKVTLRAKVSSCKSVPSCKNDARAKVTRSHVKILSNQDNTNSSKCCFDTGIYFHYEVFLNIFSKPLKYEIVLTLMQF